SKGPLLSLSKGPLLSLSKGPRSPNGPRDAAPPLRLDSRQGVAPPRGVVAGADQLPRIELLPDPATSAARPDVPWRTAARDSPRRDLHGCFGPRRAVRLRYRVFPLRGGWPEIGRASCRERGSGRVVAVLLTSNA